MEVCFLTTTLPEKKLAVILLCSKSVKPQRETNIISLKQRYFSIFSRCYSFFLGGPMSAMSIFNGTGAIDVTTEWSTWMSQEIRERLVSGL